MAAILKTKMANRKWTYQLASNKIPVQDDLNYLCAKIHNLFLCACVTVYCEPATTAPYTRIQLKPMAYFMAVIRSGSSRF